VVDKQARLEAEIRAIQGQFKPVEVSGKSYIFKRLKRRDCQETLYNLVKPLIKTISTVIEAVDVEFKDLTDANKISKAIMNNVGLVGEIFDAIPYDNIHRLAQKLLKDVIIDNEIAPDDFENPDSDEIGYYDDKQLELLQALMKAVQVNFPFLTDLMKKKGDSKSDSDQSTEKKKTE
jgi:hypothetical protein